MSTTRTSHHHHRYDNDIRHNHNDLPSSSISRRLRRSPKKHHGFTLLIMILGFLLPPLAVAVRFGIGKDFFLNVVFTICGYFPGHGHNFFIQNIRDNTNKKRTPKWAVRYGLVDQTANKKKTANRAHWVGRYNDQTAERTMYDDDGNEVRYAHNHRFEDGDDAPTPARPLQDSDLTERDQYYGNHENQSASSDPYSLRRSQSGHSSLSSSAGPGASERKAARNKSKSRAFLGRKKADRHAKSGQVMGDPDLVDPSRARRNGSGYHGDGFGESGSFNSSMDDQDRRGGSGGGYLDGPEDADSRYRPAGVGVGAGAGAGALPSTTSRAHPNNTSNGRGASAADSPASSTRGNRSGSGGDGLDHTF